MKTEKPIAIQIVDFIRSEKLEAGSHLPAQRLADLLHVSRSPINEALKLLHEKGILRREPIRKTCVSSMRSSSRNCRKPMAKQCWSCVPE